MEMIRKVNITASKSGLPCLDECGGGWTNTGFAQIVADALGRAKRAIHVRTHGELTATLERTDEKICWAAICAAVDKSHDYHCRRPYYIQQVLDEA